MEIMKLTIREDFHSGTVFSGFPIVRKMNVCKIKVHYVGKLGLAFQGYFGLVRKAQIVSREFVSRALNN